MTITNRLKQPSSIIIGSCSKVFDIVVLNQFTAYLRERKILSNHYSGNRKNHSTETLNIAFTDTILEAKGKNYPFWSLLIYAMLFDSFPSLSCEFKSYMSHGVSSVRMKTN